MDGLDESLSGFDPQRLGDQLVHLGMHTIDAEKVPFLVGTKTLTMLRSVIDVSGRWMVLSNVFPEVKIPAPFFSLLSQFVLCLFSCCFLLVFYEVLFFTRLISPARSKAGHPLVNLTEDWLNVSRPLQPSHLRVHTWCAVWIWEVRQPVMRLTSSPT